MKLLLFVLSIVFASTGFAASGISGEVVEMDGKLYLKAPGACGNYLIKAKNKEATTHLGRLSSGDSIMATGDLQDSDCSAQIESVEYVGLKRLLGYWYSPAGIITVRNFNSMSFYPMNIQDLKNDPPVIRTGEPITYRYSVTPSAGQDWVVFLSNTQSTTFATLRFNRKSIVMKIYDSDTGKVTQTMRLSRWGNLKP